MNQIDFFFLDFGFSWSLAKAIPYFLCFIFGIGLFYFLRKIKLKKKWIKGTFLLILFIAPFAIYFSFFPIYEGDFTNKGILSKNNSIQFPANKSLTVVVLPNCPYCYQSIILMKKMKERNPSMNISYWVATSDTLLKNTAILKVIPAEFKVDKRHEIEKISELVQGTYPCFILSNNSKPIKQWNNNQVGVSALDEMERFFKEN
jgi:uncharacterized membrane protein